MDRSCCFSLLRSRLASRQLFLPLLLGLGLLLLCTPWDTEPLLWRSEGVPLHLLRDIKEDLNFLRRSLVHDVCTTYHQQINTTLSTDLIKRLYLKNILVDDNRKLMYCMVPKVACTNWIRILAFTSNNVSLYRLKKLYVNPELSMAQVNHNTEWPRDQLRQYIETFPQVNLHTPNFNRAVGLSTLHNYTPEGVLHRVKTYYKFMFVRHPLERLLSAYRDKFEKSYDKPFHVYFGRYIIKQFRKNPTEEELADGHNVKFDEFIKYILQKEQERKRQNPHWMTYTDLCHPCLFNYDFIGKLETIHSDSKHVFPHLNNASVSDFLVPTMGPNSDIIRTKSILRYYYDHLTTSLFYDVRKLFDMDFLMFGYNTWP